jgi:pyruvate dehydrogenase E2 component (dihydrolipoamide acetyltransferase)
MPVTVRMPQLGETVTEGTILRWAKQPGDPIAEDEVLLEVSTDKVDTEVPSPTAGIVLEILVPAGETVPVGTPLAVIGAAAQMPAAAAAAPAAAAAAPAAAAMVPIAEAPTAASQVPLPESAAAVVPVPAAPGPRPEPVVPAPASVPEPAALAPEPLPEAAAPAAPADLGFLSPVVRKLAAENGLDLSAVKGTGREGRITRQDVEALIDARARGEVAVEEPAAPAPAVVPATPIPAEVPMPVTPIPMPVVEILPAAATAPAPAAAEEAEEEEAEEEEAEEPAVAAALPRRVGLGRGLESLIPRAEVAPAPARVTPAAPPAPAPAPVSVAPAAAAPPAVEVAPAPPAAPAAPEEAAPSRILLRPGDRVEDPSRLRVRIAEHMVANRRTAAHVWTAVEADFEVVERVRRRHLEAFKAKEGFSLTYLPFIARATVDALNAFPVVNSSFYLEEKKAVLHGAVNLGIAVDMDQRGLIVMNIPGADGMRLRELARRIRGVAEKARSGNLSPDDAAGSTFTITNPGPYGSLMSAPIINVPEVAILSTDTVVKRPVVVTDSTGADAIAVHHVGYLGLTWDHRAFDGATAVLFLRRIKESLEARDWEQELA